MAGEFRFISNWDEFVNEWEDIYFSNRSVNPKIKIPNDDVRLEILYSLPSKEIRNNVSTLGVFDTNSADIYILKCRYSDERRDSLTFDDFEFLSRSFGWLDDCNDLKGKNILITETNLNVRGKEVFYKLCGR